MHTCRTFLSNELDSDYTVGTPSVYIQPLDPTVDTTDFHSTTLSATFFPLFLRNVIDPGRHFHLLIGDVAKHNEDRIPLTFTNAELYPHLFNDA
jgi:hypothetical protein